jgi:anti-sigma factor RsiW
MRCGKAQRLISAHLDGELDGSRVPAVKQHLDTCDDCRAFAADVARFTGRLESFTAPDPRWGFTDRLMARIPEGQRSSRFSTRWLDLLRPASLGLGATAFCCGVILAVFAMANGELRANATGEEDAVSAVVGDYFDTLSETSVGEQLLALLPDEED